MQHRTRNRRTNFPQLHSEIPIGIELSRKAPTIIQDPHEPQQVFGRDGVVNLVILEQLVRRFNEQELEDAFDNDLLEDSALIRE
jgi:hypothetical protein